MSIQVVSFNCILKSKTGQIISTTYNREVLAAQIDDNGLLKGLAPKMQNLIEGEKRRIELGAEEAYGYYDPKKIILFPKNKLPKNARIGGTVQIVGKSGQIRSYKIIDSHGSMMSLDANHPLAGQDLIFEIDVISARDASSEEIQDSNNAVSRQLLH